MLFHALIFILACTEHVPKGKNVRLQASACESWTGLHQAGSPCKLQHQWIPLTGILDPHPRIHSPNHFMEFLLCRLYFTLTECFYGTHIYESDAVWYYPWLSLMSKHNFSTEGGRDNPELSLLLLGFLHINTRGVIQEVSKNKEVEKALTCHVNFEEKELSNYVCSPAVFLFITERKPKA